MSELSHVDETGAARMVDVSGKTATARTALAGGTVRTTAEVLALLADGLSWLGTGSAGVGDRI